MQLEDGSQWDQSEEQNFFEETLMFALRKVKKCLATEKIAKKIDMLRKKMALTWWKTKWKKLASYIAGKWFITIELIASLISAELIKIENMYIS